MVILQVPSNLQLQSKLSILEPKSNRQKHLSHKSSSYTSSSSRSLLISNSQKPQPPASQSVAAIIFGDGSESRLYPLTKRRSEGAIPIAANYRIIDVVVSNCVNSNINQIYAITQYNSTYLNSHLSKAYNGLGLGKEGFVQVIAAYQSLEHQGWFQGTADAMRRCLWVLEEYPITEFLLLPGHHVYKMDYQKVIKAHRNSQADITIATLNSIRDPYPGFGILKVNSRNEVLEFSLRTETDPIIVNSVKSPRKLEDSARCKYFSMGIYLVNRDVMTKLLDNYYPTAIDFGTEVIPGAISAGMKVQAYGFDGYWEDMQSIGAYYEANMDCIKRKKMGFNFYDRDSPLYSMPRFLPPTTIYDAVITDSVIGDGCFLNKCKIKGTIVGMRTRIGDRAVIEDSVIMGSDVYQDYNEENGMDGRATKIPIGIGNDTQIKGAVIDKNARIGRNVMIINKDSVQETNKEANGYIISGGIVVILQGAVIPDESIF